MVQAQTITRAHSEPSHLDWTQLVIGYWVWSQAGSGSVRIAHAILADILAISTTRVSSALDVLVRKGVLTREGGPRSAVYTPANPRVSYRRAAGHAVVDMDLSDSKRGQSNIESFIQASRYARRTRTGRTIVRFSPR